MHTTIDRLKARDHFVVDEKLLSPKPQLPLNGLSFFDTQSFGTDE